MRITAVTPFSVHPGWRKNWIFVKVETDEGLIGWGEAYSQYDRDRPVLALIEEIGRYVVGRDPFQIKHITQMAYQDFAIRRGSLEFYSAISGIEQALWDIVGRACGQPVYNLLGGPCRERPTTSPALPRRWSSRASRRSSSIRCRDPGAPSSPRRTSATRSR